MKKTSIPPPKAADPSTRSGQAPSTGSGRSLRRKAEAKMSKRKKAVASPMTEADTLRLVHELEVHQIELELQNEELVGAQAELEALLHQYTGLYDFAPAGYFTLARDGMINRANLAGANLLGVERSRLVKKHFGVFVSAKTRPVFNAFLGEVFESEGKETCEVALQKNGADPIWVNIEAIKEDERGCRVLVEDITGRKQAEEKADEARVFAESIIATVRQPLLVLDADLHVITANRSFYEVFKVKQEETEGKLLYELGNHQWNISKLRELLENILPRNTKLNNFEVEHNFENIGQKTMLVNARRVYQETNRTHLILLAIEDITERKQTEKELEKHREHLEKLVEERTAELQKSEAKFKAIFDNASDGMLLIDPKTLKFFICNTMCAKMLGHTQEEFLNLDIADIHPGEDLSFIYKQIGKFSRGEKGIRNDIRFKRKDGSIFMSDLSPALLSIAGKKYLLIIFKDITERKLLEDSLRESETRYRLLIDNSNDLIQSVGLDGRFLFVNQFWRHTLGYSEEEIAGLNLFDVIHPDHYSHCREMFDKVLNGNSVPYIEVTFAAKDGRPVYLMGSAVPRLLGEKVIAAQSFFHDITERKQAEERLHENERRLSTLMGNMPGIAYRCANDKNWTMEYVSEGCFELTGYMSDELVNNSVIAFNDIIHEEYREHLYNKWQDVLNRKGTFKDEYRIITKDGKEKWVWEQGCGIYSDDDKVIALEGFITDITERKQTEEALRESEELFKSVVHNSDALMILTDAKGVVTYLSAQCENVLGYPADKFIGKIMPDIIHPDDIAKCQHAWEQVTKQGQELHEFEYRIIDSQQGVQWISHSAKLVKVDGRILGMQNTIHNITKRKEMAEALQESEKKFRTITENSADAIFIADQQGNYVYVNQAASDLLEYTPDKLMTMNIADLASQDETKDIEEFQKLQSEGRLYTEILLKKADGTFLPVDLNAVLLPNGLNYGSCRDITDRKRAEEELKESEAKFRIFFESSPVGILIADLETKMFKYSNPCICQMLGYTENELITLNVADIHPKDALQSVIAEFEAQARGEKNLAENLPCLRKDGTIFYADINTIKIFIDGKSYNMGFFQDITEHKQAEEQIQKNLEEKEILLRELYHRTKNNMQVICAILRLQSSRQKDQGMKELLKKIEIKIYSMALVHQKLISSKDLSHLNLKEYIDSLLIHFKQNYVEPFKNISIHTDMTDINVLLDTATPLGLILDELFSNVAKHAFPEKTRGKIKVNLHITPQNKIVLEVSDNGTGLPKGFNVRKDGHLGLETAIDLVEQQLNGRIIFKSEKGLHCKITFKKGLYSKRV